VQTGGSAQAHAQNCLVDRPAGAAWLSGKMGGERAEEEGERKGRIRKEETGRRIPICVVPPTHNRVMSRSHMSFCLTQDFLNKIKW
jgi:hypothetical protein